MLKHCILILFLLGCSLTKAQRAIFVGPIGISKGNSFNVATVEPQLSLAPNPQGKSVFNQPSDHLIPDYIRENPMQYSYLCRLEKKIERKLPVGVWLKLENNNFADSFSLRPGNAYIRMKMLQF